ncbi:MULTISPECIES: helix-turn-helix transcriptional regulator [unclassified Variovorax]|mgnify:FL=1|nr:MULTISPECIES: helix-turn-helix transcriptional regulator [Variovorax]MBN8756929.1 helix-turn-helix transcriptional regulator [Variovorax sp.]UKI08673.1 helix-turn-helix domain-containing protein [Variovorax paradoxus]
MPGVPPVLFPSERKILSQLGERIKLARLRRKLSSTTVAGRAGISRTTLYKLETGEGAVTMGTCLRVLAVLGLDKDFEALASDDRVGRKLQDLAMQTAGHRKQNEVPKNP